MGYNRSMDKQSRYRRLFKYLGIAATCALLVFAMVASIPTVVGLQIASEEKRIDTLLAGDFPVTVNPLNKTIVESAHVNDFLEGSSSPLLAAAAGTESTLGRVFTWIAVTIADASWYQNLAAVNGRIAIITPGMRKEQVAATFASPLRWNSAQKKQFLTKGPYASLPLTEGSFAPGTYFFDSATTPVMAQALVNDRFSRDILSHYSTTTAALVPINQALTIASLLERESGGPTDVRIISGIIWNRLFLGMNLQIDATVQYAKATASPGYGWWPRVLPGDTSRKSAYNTYRQAGLPPTPIASPSVASVLAALNPKSTSCIFYFHDDNGNFHCTNTYKEHVAALKKIYGRGK
jgi:hypothetical protein